MTTSARVMHYAGAGVMGGLLRHLRLVTLGLIGRGHDVGVVLSEAPVIDELAAELAAAGAAVSRMTVKGKTDLTGMRRLQDLAERLAPDIFHLHLSSPIESIPALVAARLGGVKSVITTEHAPAWFPLEKPYSRAAKRAATRMIDAVIALCRADAAFLAGTFGVPVELITVIPNGVPLFARLPSRDEARKLLGFPGNAHPLVGYAGALEPKKGVSDLLAGAAKAELPGIAVALAGEGTLAPQLRQESGALPFPVFLPGYLPEVGDFLAALDIFALVSHGESMPLALLEAMHAGLPILASRVGGIPEIIEDGVTGILVEPSRPDLIAEALRKLAADPAWAKGLGEAARRAAVERFSAEVMVRQVEALYQTVMARALTAARRK